MNHINGKSLINMQVYSIKDGEILGNVKNTIIDTKEKHLIGLAISPKGWHNDLKLIHSNKIQTLGEKGITIDEKSSVQRASNLPKMLEYMHNPPKITGSKIITEDGVTIGIVEEFYINDQDFSISKLEISQNNFGKVGGKLLSGTICINGAYIQTIGNGLIVLDKAAHQNFQQQPSVISNNFTSARKNAQKIWEISMENGQNINKNLQNSLYEQKKKYILAKSRRAAQRQENQYAEQTSNV